MTHPEPAMVDTVKYKPERMLGELDELARTINVAHLEIQFFVSDPLGPLWPGSMHKGLASLALLL